MKRFLEIYPIRTCDYETQNGLVTVFYKDRKPSFVEKIFFKKNLAKPYKIDLDNIGSFVWGLCDGNNNVQTIINKTEAEFGSQVAPADNRVKLFIEQLSKNKLLSLFEKR